MATLAGLDVSCERSACARQVGYIGLLKMPKYEPTLASAGASIDVSAAFDETVNTLAIDSSVVRATEVNDGFDWM